MNNFVWCTEERTREGSENSCFTSSITNRVEYTAEWLVKEVSRGWKGDDDENENDDGYVMGAVCLLKEKEEKIVVQNTSTHF